MARDRFAPPAPGAEAARQRLFSRRTESHGAFATIQPQRNAKVTSAAVRQIKEDTPETRRRRRRIGQLDKTWQTQSYDMADKVGELGYLLNLQANVVALCDFVVRRWDPDTASWVPNDPGEDGYDEKPGQVMEAFIGPTGGRSELVRRAAYNLFAAGETVLLGTSAPNKGILWEFLSVEEATVDANGIYIRRRNGLLAADVEAIPDDAYVARCWHSDPRFSEQAFSEVRRVLPILNEIVTLTQMVDAVAKSRLAAGILFVPEELSFVRPDAADADETPDHTDGDIDGFLDTLVEHLSAPVTDPSSAARLVPLIIRGKAEWGEKITLIDLARTLDTMAQDLRQEALGRLAQGLDTPPEVMRGMGATNHWSSSLIDDAFLVKHIQPIGQLLADFITLAYLRPMLEAFEGLSEDEAAHWRIEFDPSPVAARSDEARSARDLADYLSDEAIVTANGFSKGDLASEEERKIRRAWQLIMAAPKEFGGLLPEIPGFKGVDLESLALPTPEPPAPPPGAADPNADPATDPNAAPKPGASDMRTPKNGKAKTDRTKNLVDAETGAETPAKPEKLALLVERVAAFADATVTTAVDRAASRVISSAQSRKNDPFTERIRQVSNKARVMSLATDDDLARFGQTRRKLIDGAFDQFAVTVNSWIAAAFLEAGLDMYTAGERASFATQVLCTGLADHLEANLYTPPRRNAGGLLVDRNMIEATIESSFSLATV